MAWMHPAAVEYRRRRFTRHDAHRGLKVNPEPWLSPEELRLQYPELYERKFGVTPSRTSPSTLDILRSDETTRLRALCLLRAAQVQVAMIRHLLALQRKANFNPSQPRVPAGNPDGGQWTSDGGGSERINDPRIVSDAISDSDWKPGAQYAQARGSTRDRAQGHHKLPVAHYERLPLPPETRKVFDDARRAGCMFMVTNTTGNIGNIIGQPKNSWIDSCARTTSDLSK